MLKHLPLSLPIQSRSSASCKSGIIAIEDKSANTACTKIHTN